MIARPETKGKNQYALHLLSDCSHEQSRHFKAAELQERLEKPSRAARVQASPNLVERTPGAEEPECTWGHMRIPRTAQRRNRVAQEVFQAAQRVPVVTGRFYHPARRQSIGICTPARASTASAGF